MVTSPHMLADILAFEALEHIRDKRIASMCPRRLQLSALNILCKLIRPGILPIEHACQSWNCGFSMDIFLFRSFYFFTNSCNLSIELNVVFFYTYVRLCHPWLDTEKVTFNLLNEIFLELYVKIPCLVKDLIAILLRITSFVPSLQLPDQVMLAYIGFCLRCPYKMNGSSLCW